MILWSCQRAILSHILSHRCKPYLSAWFREHHWVCHIVYAQHPIASTFTINWWKGHFKCCISNIISIFFTHRQQCVCIFAGMMEFAWETLIFTMLAPLFSIMTSSSENRLPGMRDLSSTPMNCEVTECPPPPCHSHDW